VFRNRDRPCSPELKPYLDTRETYLVPERSTTLLGIIGSKIVLDYDGYQALAR
jgi:hypothetical protein